MSEISVFVQKNDKNKFFYNLFNEFDSEIVSSVGENQIVLTTHEENVEKVYDVIVKNIFEEFSPKILIKVINNICGCFTKQDKYEIWKMSFGYLMNDMLKNNSEHKNRISVIKEKLKEFCETSKCICVDGFVNFRLKELEENFEDMIEDCVREYMLEAEYKEFISMIKYFVAVQSPIYLSVEVLYDDDIIIMADGKNITERCIDEFNGEINCLVNDKDDFLLNSLISIAPKRIIIKQKNNYLNEEFKKTLLGIFGDKLKIKTE